MLQPAELKAHIQAAPSNVSTPAAPQKLGNKLESWLQKRLQKRLMKKMSRFWAQFLEGECDLIKKVDGTDIQAKVVAVADSVILYEACEGSSDSTFLIRKQLVYMIRYQDGRVSMFNKNITQPSENAGLKTALAVASIVASVAGLIFNPFWIVGIVLGVIQLIRIQREPEVYGGKLLAILGIALGFLPIFFFLLLFIVTG